MVVGENESTKIKRVLVKESSDEEMENANTRGKRFVTALISRESSKFRNLKKQLDSKAFVNSYKKSQDQLTDREDGALSEKDVSQNLAKDGWIISSKLKYFQYSFLVNCMKGSNS